MTERAGQRQAGLSPFAVLHTLRGFIRGTFIQGNVSEPSVGISRRSLYVIYAVIGIGVVVFFFLSIAIGLSLVLIGAVIYLFNRKSTRSTRGAGQPPPTSQS